MKLIFIQLFFTISSFATQAQKFSIQELLNFQKSDADYFEKAASKKGYEYSSTDDDSDVNTITYSYFMLKGTRKAFFIRHFSWKAGWKSVLYQITDRLDYIKLKDEAKAIGYKFYKTEKVGDNIITCYKKGSISIRFNTTANGNEQVIENNTFEVDISPLIEDID